MTSKELIKKAKAAGWHIEEGGRHTLAVNLNTKVKIAIPRHKGDIPDGTLQTILKRLGL